MNLKYNIKKLDNKKVLHFLNYLTEDKKYVKIDFYHIDNYSDEILIAETIVDKNNIYLLPRPQLGLNEYVYPTEEILIKKIEIKSIDQIINFIIDIFKFNIKVLEEGKIECNN